MMILLLIILALALLAKTASPYIAFRPPTMYTRPIPRDPTPPGLLWTLSP